MKEYAKGKKIFVVEPDPLYQKMIRYYFELNPDHKIFTFSSAKECLQNMRHHPHCIFSEAILPDMETSDFLKKVAAFKMNTTVVFVSETKNEGLVNEWVAKKAADFIAKDEALRSNLLDATAELSKIPSRESSSALNGHHKKQPILSNLKFSKDIIATSPAMDRVLKLVVKAAQTDINVYLTGETGTGKEVMAKIIHESSRRTVGAFVAVNMSAIPKDLLESELFGHEKGAFTGAVNQKKGLFELADGGTLFLDEIAEMDLQMQAKVLRALQEREIVRVGGQQPIPFDARIIIATHRDLTEEVSKGRFREDLYYRLLGLNIQLPPLRERKEDILPMAKTFLNAFIKKNQIAALDISAKALEKLKNHTFPGNVRELKAVVELAAVMTSNTEIEPDDIQFKIPTKRAEDFFESEPTFEEYKRKIIDYYLEKYDNNVLLVARKLDIGKSTIYRMIKSPERAMWVA